MNLKILRSHESGELSGAMNPENYLETWFRGILRKRVPNCSKYACHVFVSKRWTLCVEKVRPKAFRMLFIVYSKLMFETC